MRLEHVWWLVNLSSKQLIAAYEDTRFGTLREMTLPRCVDVWGWHPPEAAETINGASSTPPGINRLCNSLLPWSCNGRPAGLRVCGVAPADHPPTDGGGLTVKVCVCSP